MSVESFNSLTVGDIAPQTIPATLKVLSSTVARHFLALAATVNSDLSGVSTEHVRSMVKLISEGTSARMYCDPLCLLVGLFVGVFVRQIASGHRL